MFVSIGSFTNIIQRIADARSENGAGQNRLNMVNELLIQNQTNLEAAYGRIMDADMALESTRFETKCTSPIIYSYGSHGKSTDKYCLNLTRLILTNRHVYRN